MQSEYAETLKYISQHGEAALYAGPLGDILVDYMKAQGGFIAREDLASYKTVERAPIRADYRGWEILGPPPPAASGVHIAQMLNILEGYDVRASGFGTAETIHLLAEVLKIAFADRAAASGDPDYIKVPVERLISKEYAGERRRAIDVSRAQQWSAGVSQLESAHTTHMTAADSLGNVVATTQTINNLFGAKILIPGLGTVPNNYMNLYDPRPGHALSLAPGKRVTTSMSPMMALRNGKLAFALGLPGGKRIFPSALQALINLIDHGMSLQEAVEAPRVWTEGNALEVEFTIPESVRAKLTAWGHKVAAVPTVAGGMNAIQFGDDGMLTGAACWRADGTPIGPGRWLGASRCAVRAGVIATSWLAVQSPGYFRTQITRTTDAFASADPPDAFTPLALRKSRTVSADTSVACAAGAAFGGPATTSGFSSAMPANFPSASSAAAPEKPSPGAGDSAGSPPLPIGVTNALMLLTAAAPPWLCGSAMPVRSRLGLAAPLAIFSGFNPRAP